ncbi:TspO and MBR related proteins [Alkalibacterium subtropicum]|uniref:TspO and MBR related proteins n=1 Tax=Alkalibacterium subtropicum TaxID=753702 RepID=A0A1I1HQR6_9LACT|nr:TspO/MBR family protein [Alkalibacterium subtropicum]SFC23793.1 TspO and MBR related proteins [Alkalibacterium subtropicum]
MKTKTKAWISAGLLALTLIVNAMGAFGWINDMSQQEVSDMYPTLITPAPSTFSIWSVIYTFLIISIILMLIRYNDAYYEEAIEEINYLFWLSCFLNIIWIITFSYILIGLSTLFIFAFLIVMVLIVKRVGKIQTKRRWLLPLTFGLYSGWLFIATVVNISAWLVKIEWNGFGIAEEIWAVTVLLIAVGLTAFVLFNTENAIFPIPIAWAYFGIYNKLISPEGYQGDYTALQYTALIGIVLLIGLAAIQFYKNHYKIMPRHLEKDDV